MFSPQNLAAKLLSSLNNKSDQSLKVNDMLIYDDVSDQMPEIIAPKYTNESKDTAIETGEESLNTSPLQHKEPEMIDHREEIVDDLLDRLVYEIKDNLFPRRDGLCDYMDINDPISCFAPLGKSLYSQFSNNQLITKLAFESEKGIGTDLGVLDHYLKDVIDEIMKNESTFINNILTPIQRDPMEMLRLLQSSEIGNYAHFDTYDPIIPILGVEIYLEIERRREIEKLESGENSDRSHSATDSLVTECEHIHNKAIFDCINESLNQFRPYGKEGVPMTWSTKLRKLREDEILEFSKMFEIIKQDLFRWGYTTAGTLPKREFITDGEHFDEDHFNEIREKRLASLLATDVMETEYKWINYDFEEAQVKIDICDMILEHIMTETTNLMSNIGSNATTQSLYRNKEELDKVFNFSVLPETITDNNHN